MVDIYFKQTIIRPVVSKLIELFYMFFIQILQRTVTGLQLVFIHQIKKKTFHKTGAPYKQRNHCITFSSSNGRCQVYQPQVWHCTITGRETT